jgi:5-deoxy-glucuronate isomerase
MRRSNEWFFPAGSLADDGWQTVVDARIDGWRHTALHVGELGNAPDGAKAREQLTLAPADIERICVPLAGSFTVEVSDDDGESRFELSGRRSVFDGPTDVLYVGTGAAVRITGHGRIAVAEAPTGIRKPTNYIPADDVPLELRGAGRSSRQVHNFGTPAALDAAKLIVCEVITPAENWSSYPAHKHDTFESGVESRLEEIYYFETAVTRGADAPPAAAPFGLFSSYDSPAGAIDTNALVHTGDVALVPFGYHGPAAAAPGYDLYYLNVMAGPDAERVWNITDDPAHAWVRSAWEDQVIDPRLPYTSAPDGAPHNAPLGAPHDDLSNGEHP